MKKLKKLLRHYYTFLIPQIFLLIAWIVALIIFIVMEFIPINNDIIDCINALSFLVAFCGAPTALLCLWDIVSFMKLIK